MSRRKNPCGQERELFLAEVKSVGVSDPSRPQAQFDVPFFDETLSNRFISIPKAGEVFMLEVAMASRWSTGQWIHIENVGKYPIVNILGDTKIILENKADIVGNPDAGSQFLGARKIWLTIEQKANVNVQLDAVVASLLDPSFDPCMNMDQNNAAENGYAVGAIATSSVCEPCGTTSKATKIKRCVKAWTNVLFKHFTIALPLVRGLDKNSVTYKEGSVTVTKPVKDVVWNPESGDLATRDIPSTNAVDAYVDGYKTYVAVPADYASFFYVLSPSKSNGAPTFRKFDFKSAHRIGTSVAAGTVNVKTIVEAALGITLPSSGEFDIGVVATATQETPGASVAQADATVDGIVVASTKNQDNIANGYRMVTIDLSAPSIVFAGGTFVIESAYIPFSYYYQD